MRIVYYLTYLDLDLPGSKCRKVAQSQLPVSKNQNPP